MRIIFKTTVYFTFFMLLVVSCSKPIEHNEKIMKIISTDLDFQNYISNVKPKKEYINIKERNILIINCDSNGNCEFDNKPMSLNEIRSEVKKLLISHIDSAHLPQLVEKEFNYLGTIFIPSNFLMSAKYDNKLPFEKYFNIRNEILKGYSEVRNELAQLKFNKSMFELIKSNKKNDAKRLKEIYSAYPIRYTEMIN